jgi:hypothetical protein
MSQSQPTGFAQLVPGFDFLQNLAKGATEALPQMPSLSSWVAPTLNVEELDKRIQELRAVQFWLDQNAKALAATIQALEVQKMTLATLQGMNMSMNELAESLKLKPQASAPAAAPAPAAAAPAPQAEPAPRAKAKANSKEADAAASVIDPMQWWGSLTQQFQHIAANAMQDVAKNAAAGSEAVAQAAGVKKPAAKKAAAPKAKAAKKAPARKAAPRA